MKTITMDFETYNNELMDARGYGREAALREVDGLFRLLFVKCDKGEAWYKAYEIFGTSRAESICMHLGLTKPEL